MADPADPGPGLLQAVRRSPVVVVVIVLVGGLLGLGFTFLRDTGYTAQAEMVVGTPSDVTLYAQDQSGQPGARAQAAAVAMRSHEVAKAASALLDDEISTRLVQRSTTVAPGRDSAVVTVSARSDDARRAADIANAVVRAYDTISGEEADAAGQRAQSVLARQEDRLRTKIDGVKKEQTTRAAKVEKGLGDVEATERDRLLQLALSSDPEYQTLVNKQSRLSDTLGTIQDTESQNVVDTQLVSGGTSTVYAAPVPRRDETATLVRNILVGVVVGLLVGSVVAWRRLDRETTDRRRAPASTES